MINPNRSLLKDADINIILAATEKNIMMVEGEGKECEEAGLIKAIEVVGAKGVEDVIRVRVFLAVSKCVEHSITSTDAFVQRAEDIEAVGEAFSAVFAKDGKELGVAMTAVITGFVSRIIVFRHLRRLN